MIVTVVGLGLIGASLCRDLLNKGFIVNGVDSNDETLNYALNNKYVTKCSLDLNDFIEESDLIIFAIYPSKIKEELKKYKFKENQVISDVSGIKKELLKDINKIVYPATYVSVHPMAGREKVGICHSVLNLFKDANFIIIKDDDTKDSAILLLKKIANL